LFGQKSRVERIHGALEVLIGLLESSQGRKLWINPLRGVTKITNATHLCNAIQTMYGGMGSFNDIVFHNLNEDTDTEKELSVLNERFCHHRARLYNFTKRRT